VSQTPTAEDEAVAFASDLIRIDASNGGGGDCRERPAAEYVAEHLTEVGLEPVLLEAAPAAPT
jgi:acetylornithine deacetylase/succinyl-diaminopimelate desuccinylase-like protein